MKSKIIISLFAVCISTLMFLITGCDSYSDCVFGEWQVTKEPTCTQKGEEQRVCTNDSTHVEKRDIDMLPHTPGKEVKENEILPTCGNVGSYDLVTYCTACQSEISRRNVELSKLV